MNSYKPEGLLLRTAENYEATHSLAALEKAMEQRRILESVAILCDKSFALHVELGEGIMGIIPREEVQYSPLEPVKDIAILTRVGKPVCFTVTGFTQNDNGEICAMLSRKSAQKECMEHYIRTLLPGDIVPCRVTHMESFGAFMDIGCGMISLMTIDNISVSRISHPKERFHVGDILDAVIKTVDPSGRIYVSRRELLGTWEENAALFSPGETVVGVVRSIESYGVFVELTPNLAGLAEWKAGISVEDVAAVFIKSIIPEKMKIKLVIIDSHAPHSAVTKSGYVYPGTAPRHIDTWRYSPLSCEKIIESNFEPQPCIFGER